MGGSKGRNVRGPQRGGRFGGRDIRYENQGRYANFGSSGGGGHQGGGGNFRNFGGNKFGDRGGMSYPMQGGGGYGGNYGGYGGYGGYSDGGPGGMQQMSGGMPRGQPSVPVPTFTPGGGPTPGQAYGGQPGAGSGAW